MRDGKNGAGEALQIVFQNGERLRRSPPDSRPMVVCCRSGGNRKRSSMVLAENVPSSVFTCAATL